MLSPMMPALLLLVSFDFSFVQAPDELCDFRFAQSYLKVHFIWSPKIAAPSQTIFLC
jgi:hypothetical protein